MSLRKIGRRPKRCFIHPSGRSSHAGIASLRYSKQTRNIRFNSTPSAWKLSSLGGGISRLPKSVNILQSSCKTSQARRRDCREVSSSTLRKRKFT